MHLLDRVKSEYESETEKGGNGSENLILHFHRHKLDLLKEDIFTSPPITPALQFNRTYKQKGQHTTTSSKHRM